MGLNPLLIKTTKREGDLFHFCFFLKRTFFFQSSPLPFSFLSLTFSISSSLLCFKKNRRLFLSRTILCPILANSSTWCSEPKQTSMRATKTHDLWLLQSFKCFPQGLRFECKREIFSFFSLVIFLLFWRPRNSLVIK